PFLTSLFFRAGYISADVLFILNAPVFIFGVAGFYLLLRQRFNQIQSFTGSLIFLSFPLIFTWAVSGGIDIPGVSFSIWTIYLLVLGVRKDSRYLYLVAPLLMLAFIARYTSFLLVFPIFFYLIMNDNLLKNFKKIIIGILASLILVAPFMIYFYTRLGNLNPFINMFVSTVIGARTAVNDLAYNPDRLYFLYNLLNYISIGPLQGFYRVVQNPSQGTPSIIAYILIIIVLFGLGIYLYRIIKKKIENIDSNRNKTIIHSSILVVLLGLGVWSFLYSSYLITELIFLATLFTGYRLFKGTGRKLEVDLLFLSWFAAFFIFHSIILIKVDRYFITMSPALAYFIILGLSTVIEKYKSSLSFKKIKSQHIYLIIGIILLISTAAVHIGHSPKHGYGYHIQNASDWLTQYDPNYQDKKIYSDYDPAVTWSLKKDVKFGVPRLHQTPEYFGRFLLDHEADYYIDTLTDPKWEIPGFRVIKKMGSIWIYQRDS
ncbi:MAG TPA: glycosyltransferase family 39 protein, partial [Methanobacterium sp.]